MTGTNIIEIGTVFANRYRVEELLGCGGMGMVFLASDQMLDNEKVAIKLLHQHRCTNEKYAKRFLREIKLTRKITHPNIVRTFDVGISGKTLFYTMEYVAGESVGEKLARGEIDIQDAIGIVIEMCKGLAAIHEAGIVHRDLKPSNALYTEDSEVKIADFGIATPRFSSLTDSCEVLGSVHYIAPEIWGGKEAGSAVDIYALGALSFELLTGIKVFDGESPVDLMHRHLHSRVVPPMELRNEIPHWMNSLVLQMLEKDPDDRPDSAAALAEKMEALLADYRTYYSGTSREDYNDCLNSAGSQQASNRSNDTLCISVNRPAADDPAMSSTSVDKLVSIAGETLLKSWASDKEKSDAIEFLEAMPGEEAADYLMRAVEKYSSLNGGGLHMEDQWPRAGVAAARAARALASANHSALGIDYLLDLLVSDSNDLPLRDCAAYGLAGSTARKALAALTEALNFEETELRFSATLALKESLGIIGQSRREDVCKAIDKLAALAVYRDFKPAKDEDDGAMFARYLVVGNMTDNAKAIVLEALQKPVDIEQACTAAEILSAWGTPEALQALVDVLKDKNRDLELYTVIGNCLRGSEDSYVQEVASILLEEKSVLGGIFSSLRGNGRRSAALSARREAAEAILS